jgi:hypothetical protein
VGYTTDPNSSTHTLLYQQKFYIYCALVYLRTNRAANCNKTGIVDTLQHTQPGTDADDAKLGGGSAQPAQLRPSGATGLAYWGWRLGDTGLGPGRAAAGPNWGIRLLACFIVLFQCFAISADNCLRFGARYEKKRPSRDITGRKRGEHT